MNGKKTFVWAVGLAALAAFYYFYEIQGGQKRHEAAKQQKLLVHDDVRASTGLTVKRAGETVAAVKRQGHWHLIQPLSVPGDDQKYRELVRYLAELRYQRLVVAQPESLEPFGLIEPVLEIQLQIKNRPEPLRVRLGARSPIGSGYYAQVGGRPSVYLVDTAAKDALDASLFDLRDKTVFSFVSADVHEVHLRSDTTAPIVLQRRGDDHWQMTAPFQARGDDMQIRELLRRLHEAKVQAFVSENPTNLEPYGLRTPVFQISLVIGRDRAVKTLLFGNLDADAKGVYVKRQDAGNVLLLAQPFWQALPKTATALRDKTLLQFDREHVVRIEMRSPKEDIVITRSRMHEYRLEQPVQDVGDRDAIYGLLGALKDLKAKEFVAESPVSAASYGLESPRLRITLTEEHFAGEASENHWQMMLVGDNAPEDQQGIYVQLASRPTVYVVDGAQAQRIIEATAFDLRNKRVLTFDTKTVRKIHLEYPASAFTLERYRDAWKFSEPRTRMLPQGWKVDNLIDDLSALEYAGIVSRTHNEAAYGLDAPAVRISLWRDDGTPIGPLAIGRPTDSTGDDIKSIYAWAGSETALYIIKSTFLDTLPKTLADFGSGN